METSQETTEAKVDEEPKTALERFQRHCTYRDVIPRPDAILKDVPKYIRQQYLELRSMFDGYMANLADSAMIETTRLQSYGGVLRPEPKSSTGNVAKVEQPTGV